ERDDADRGWRIAEHPSDLIAPLLQAQAAARSGEKTAAGRPGPDWTPAWSLPAIDRIRDPLTALASYHPGDTLSPAVAERLYGPVLHGSVSALEQFAACPFRFLVHTGLRAEERRLFEADARQQGIFQHEILAEFHRQLQAEGRPWRDLSPSEARDRVGRVA